MGRELVTDIVLLDTRTIPRPRLADAHACASSLRPSIPPQKLRFFTSTKNAKTARRRFAFFVEVGGIEPPSESSSESESTTFSRC